MLKEISAYLEAAWAAEEFNRFTSNIIMVPFSFEEMEQRVASINSNMDVEMLGSAILFDNITIKEYAIKSVRACFKSNKPGSAIDKKRAMIEKELEEASAPFIYAQTA